uniref:CaM kinase-like vesicle-associated protein n=1 Tax=Salmo trutta TaxID=8032 RepID=A0A673ZZ80_SALTR
MPFGCLTLGEKKDYNNPSEVTDKYDLGQIVKSEEFCEIFRAKDKNTLKMFTCKKFLKKDGRKVRKAAKNEILILKMVKHHNILQLVDVFETRKEYFLFLELATGREVFDWILDQGYYSERDTSNVVRQVLEAVAYLHSQRIVHRNLKLENLVYFNRLKHSKIVISDFHLAKLENRLIKDPCGTPEYLAPEVVGRQRYGRPVDCWAIGVIVYILLSGNPPFYDEMEDDDYDNHDKNLFRKILSGDYEFDSPYWDDISDSAKSLVASLMEVEQDQRLAAQEAINHEWISGNAASDKNIRDGVCGQIEKNFAKAKWKKAVRVTTMMKRLRAPEQRDSGASSPVPGGSTCPVTSSNTPVPSADAPEGTPVSTEASVTLQVPDSQNPPAIVTPDDAPPNTPTNTGRSEWLDRAAALQPHHTHPVNNTPPHPPSCSISTATSHSVCYICDCLRWSVYLKHCFLSLFSPPVLRILILLKMVQSV